jgi:hypothetical protein
MTRKQQNSATTSHDATPPVRPAPATETPADTTAGNRPVQRIRLGFCQAAIWENQGEYGVRYSVSLERLYTDDEGNWQYTRTFNAGDLPTLAALLQLAIADIHQRRTDPWNGGE